MPPDELAIKTKMPAFKRGISANIRNSEEKLKETDPTTVKNRLGMIFDDSGSMGNGDDSKLQDAKKAVKNFTLSCNIFDTSITIYPLNLAGKPLTIDYDLLNMYILGIESTGGTPLYTKLQELIEKENITRTVVFSDGGPTDSKLVGVSESWDSKPKDFALSVIKKYTDKEIPIDTIFIGEDYSYDSDSTHCAGYRELEELAKMTGGIFIHFKDAKSLTTGLKYLAPKYRALLANAELKDKIQKGENV